MQKRTTIFTIITILVVLVLSFTIITASAGTNIKYGDSDLDGDVTILDALAIQKDLAQLAKLSQQGTINAKVENGVTLSIIDASLIQRKLASLIDHFPVEDLDPTEKPTEKPTTKPTDKPTDKPTEVPTQPVTEKETVPAVKDTVTIYFTNNNNWSKVNAYIYNNTTSKEESAWPGKAMTKYGKNDYQQDVYSISINLKQYDRIIFNNGSSLQTTDTPVTAASSGFFIRTDMYGKYVVGTYAFDETDTGKIETVKLDYPKSATKAAFKKKITIWLPKGYSTSKKYSVLYMTDGQNCFGDISDNEWEADETVLALQKNGGDGIIVVGIDNSDGNRDSELTPPITSTPKEPGSSRKFTTPTGDVFSNFVVNTVIPYIDSHYSTNSIRGIAGSSSGGIEAFYIGIENMDKFDYIGALSPAFLLFTQNEWNTYLNTKDFTSKDLPRIHFYYGNSTNDSLEREIYTYGKDMSTWMKNHNYPTSLMKDAIDNDGIHHETFWTVYLPETISFGLNLTR